MMTIWHHQPSGRAGLVADDVRIVVTGSIPTWMVDDLLKAGLDAYRTGKTLDEVLGMRAGLVPPDLMMRTTDAFGNVAVDTVSSC